MSWKTRQKTWLLFFVVVVMIVLNYHLPELPQVSFLSQHKFCLHVCHDKHMFVATHVCLLRQNFCHDKHIFVVKSCSNKTCHDKLTFVATKTCLSWQNTAIVMTNTCLSRQIFVATKVLLRQKYFATKVLSQQAYFCCTKDVFWHNKCACCEKHMFVVTKPFVATKIILVAAPASDTEPVPPTSSEPVDNRPPTLKNGNKPAMNLPVPANGQGLTKHQRKFSDCRRGRVPISRLLKVVLLILCACTEFCSRHETERQKLD